MSPARFPRFASNRRQRGVATLFVTLVILVILTLIVLSSTNVALFEQRTATNENRQRLSEQAAEYALSLGGEFLKANIVNIASTGTNGWLKTGSLHWLSCRFISSPATHPCLSEPNPVRRAELYYYSFDGTANDRLIRFQSLVPNAGSLSNVVTPPAGSAAFFGATAEVGGLLCRLDTTITPTPACVETPSPKSENRIAITLIAKSQLSGENAASEIKETWANFSTFSTTAAVPLVASGAVNGAGDVEIVTAANGGGYGVPVSIWSSTDADVDKSGGGAATISSCQLGEFLKNTPESELKTTCATNSTACGCPAANVTDADFLSGNIPSSSPPCCENIDILDRDGNKGKNPDIQYFPGSGIDSVADLADDSLFEWVFNVSNESESKQAPISGTGGTLQNCGPGADQNCAIFDLTEADRLNAQLVTCAALGILGPAASGLYYVTDSSAGTPCDLPAQVGSPSSPAIVVISDEAHMTNSLFYGLLFIRSNNNSAALIGNGNCQVYGAVVVQGAASISGKLRLVYDDTSASGPGSKFPDTTRLARLPGSWLDSSLGGF